MPIWGSLLHYNLKVAWINPAYVWILLFPRPKAFSSGTPKWCSTWEQSEPAHGLYRPTLALLGAHGAHRGHRGCMAAQATSSCPEPNSAKSVLSPAHSQDKAAAGWGTWHGCACSQTCFLPLHRTTAMEQALRLLKAELRPLSLHELDANLSNPNYYS